MRLKRSGKIHLLSIIPRYSELITVTTVNATVLIDSLSRHDDSTSQADFVPFTVAAAAVVVDDDADDDDDDDGVE